MYKILKIISSPRGDASNSIKLSNAIIDKLRQKDPDSVIITKDLTKEPFPHLETSHLNAFLTPIDQQTDTTRLAARHSDQAIQEIMDSDILVIGAPMYNFGIASTLKSWLDHISRAGITFKYTPEGPIGLIENKKVYLAVTSGGIYSKGPYAPFDFLTPYLLFQLAFIGLTEVKVIRAEGFALKDTQFSALDVAINNINL